MIVDRKASYKLDIRFSPSNLGQSAIDGEFREIKTRRVNLC